MQGWRREFAKCVESLGRWDSVGGILGGRTRYGVGRCLVWGWLLDQEEQLRV